MPTTSTHDRPSEATNLFKKCQGHGACAKDGSHCNACGRSHSETAQTRSLLYAMVDHVMEHDYQNVEEFIDYIGKHVFNIVKSRREDPLK